MATGITVSIPSINIPLADPEGMTAEQWYQFFDTLFKRTGGVTGDSGATTAALLSELTSVVTSQGNTIVTQGTDIAAIQAALPSYAPLASPPLTGVPTAPTASPGTNTTQLATTAFVEAAIATIPGSPVTSVAGRTGAVVLTSADVGLSNVNNTSDATKFTSTPLTGVPTAPTASPGTNTTQLATTAFVEAAIAPLAPLASPALTGTPTAPTNGTATDASTQVATDAFVQSAISYLLSWAFVLRDQEDGTQRIIEAGTPRIQEN